MCAMSTMKYRADLVRDLGERAAKSMTREYALEPAMIIFGSAHARALRIAS